MTALAIEDRREVGMTALRGMTAPDAITAPGAR
jgi:hypothetical protein